MSSVRRPPATDRAVGSNGHGGPADRSLFARLGRFDVRHRRIVIVVWLVVFAVMGTFSKGLNDRLSQGGFESPGSDSLAVQNLIQDRFNEQPASAFVVVHGDTATVKDASFRALISDLSGKVRGVPHVKGIQWADTPNFVSPDGHTTFIVAGLEGDQNQNLLTARAISAATDGTGPAGFRVETGGSAAFYDRFDDISRTDLQRAEKISFPVTLAVLLVAFATVVAAGLPLMLAIISLVITLGALYFLAGVTSMSVFVTNTASAIGIGVGIDYALFIVTRFREELRRGRSVADAVPRTLTTSGRAVTLSGATVIVALFGMFLVNVEAFRSMAIGSMVVVAVAVLGAITLIPAVLSVLGPRVDKFRLPFLAREPSSTTGFWHRWAMSIMRRPWTYVALSLAVLLMFAFPLLSMRMGQSGSSALPAGEGPRVASEMLAGGFGSGVTGPVTIVLRTPGGATTPANLAAINRLSAALAHDPAAAQVLSLTTLVPGTDLAGYEALYRNGLPPALASAGAGLADWKAGADLARITVVGRDSPETRSAETFVSHIREGIIPSLGLQGRALVGGETAFNLDLEHEITGRLPFVVLTVLALSFLLLMMAFRSLLLPLKAIVMNLLSVGAAYGLLTAIFQWGWGQSLFGFKSEGHISVFIPMFLFSILFGLSMDYEVFLMSRIREEYQRTGSNELAVAHGLESSARTITSAALIMVTVFGAFAASRLVPFKELGFGLASAVFIDATIVRTVLVPAAMKLMGDWNWWIPRWLDRLLPRIALETESDEEPTPAADLQHA